MLSFTIMLILSFAFYATKVARSGVEFLALPICGHGVIVQLFCCCLEAVSWRCSVKKVFLEISRNSRENTCARVSFLIKLQAEAYNFIKNEPLAQVFSCEFCEILRTPFFSEHLRWLLLVVTIAVLACIAFNYFLKKLLMRWYVTTGFSEKI